MRILYLDWPCFGRDDAPAAITELGYEIVPFFHEDYQALESEGFTKGFKNKAETYGVKACFSYNYYPLVAKCCHDLNIQYISLVYDSPFIHLYSYTLVFPTNHVFLFDRTWYNEFHNAGIQTVHYIVLPVNTNRITQLLQQPYNKERVTADVSFVGALYNERHNLFDKISGKNEYLDGYLEGIMDAQRKIWGYNFIEEMLTPDIMEELQKLDPYQPDKESVAAPTYGYANYHIARKITQVERKDLLLEAGKKYNVKLFTLDKDSVIPGTKNMGICDYYLEMPLVFYHSKINLNITLRSIKSGIPLRCMDILGAGGFLLSNYQAELLEHFVPGEEFDYYESKEDMMTKIDYYLSHEKERAQIAENGYRKAKELYNYHTCFAQMFRKAFAGEDE